MTGEEYRCLINAIAVAAARKRRSLRGLGAGGGISPTHEIQTLPGVGKRRGDALRRLGLDTIEQLARHLPLRYEDRRAESGAGSGPRAIAGTVRGVGRAGRRVTVEISSPAGDVRAVWLHRPYMAARLNRGDWVGLWGSLTGDRPGMMIEPEVAAGPARRPVATLHWGRLVPVYPVSAGISQRLIRELAAVAAVCAATVADPIPPSFLPRYSLAPLAQAILDLHFPSCQDSADRAKDRLLFDRALGRQLWFELKRSARCRRRGLEHVRSSRWPEFFCALPFTLTAGQQRALAEITADMARPWPMNRLLLGDVGSGKTAVAIGASCWAALAGSQAALLAPTDIVASQHVRALDLLRPLGITCALLTGATPAAERGRITAGLRDGSIQVVVGTHALLSEDVRFESLGLAVVDEQHRFGVEQRRCLAGKGQNVDQLALTATPIPRTVALAGFGHMDVSRIGGRPPGRSQATTEIRLRLTAGELDREIRTELARGGRTFVVCPRLERDEPGIASAEAVYRRMVSRPDRDYGIELIHGRMDASVQREVVDRFRRGEVGALIATSVIEVGIDVEQATAIIVLGAERFGLAALHQLRGRVGRGALRGRCILIPSGQRSNGRLDVLARTDQGTAVAMEDLRQRGPGEMFGLRQHGLSASDAVISPAQWRRAREVARLLTGPDGLSVETLLPLVRLYRPGSACT